MSTGVWKDQGGFKHFDTVDLYNEDSADNRPLNVKLDQLLRLLFHRFEEVSLGVVASSGDHDMHAKMGSRAFNRKRKSILDTFAEQTAFKTGSAKDPARDVNAQQPSGGAMMLVGSRWVKRGSLTVTSPRPLLGSDDEEDEGERGGGNGASGAIEEGDEDDDDDDDKSVDIMRMNSLT